MDTLTTLVEKALAKWPGLAYQHGSSRAEAAAELVAADEVEYRGSDGEGCDLWRVSGHEVSVKGGSCTCQDRLAPHDGKGPLCKHRLAVMFAFKLQTQAANQLRDLLTTASGSTLSLRIEVYIRGLHRTYVLSGHLFAGGTWERYELDQRCEFDQAMFDAAIRAGGWVLKGAPVSQTGYANIYTLVRGQGEVGAPVSLHARPADMVARVAHEARLHHLSKAFATAQEAHHA